MRKSILLLALGMFLSASAANACDGDKASLKTGKGNSCCMKGTKAKACTMKSGKACTDDPKCIKEMKANKAAVKKDASKG